MNVATLARRWGSRLRPGAVILGYHRIARAGRDPFQLCVAPENFRQHLEVLVRSCRTLPLHVFVRQLVDGRLDANAVAVTLDDGYVDNLSAAKPLLERWGVPATVHIVTGALGGRFWWDDLSDLVGDDREVLRLHRRLVRLPGSQRSAVIEAMRRGRDTRAGDALDRAMSTDELHSLAAGGLVALGAHSVTHQLLTTLNAADQRDEIVSSKAQLEAIIEHPVEGFAYPHGPGSAVTRTIAREAGFAWACGAHEAVVRGRTDSFYLPRLWPPDVDGDVFERWLARWAPAVRRKAV